MSDETAKLDAKDETVIIPASVVGTAAAGGIGGAYGAGELIAEADDQAEGEREGERDEERPYVEGTKDGDLLHQYAHGKLPHVGAEDVIDRVPGFGKPRIIKQEERERR
jgi:hypothetical protein